MMDLKLRITGDGSHTLWLPEIDETYHSTHGALQESQHVFITNGLSYSSSKNLRSDFRILEIGFGTGLNTWLSWIFAIKHQLQLRYTSLEPHPLPDHLVTKLNYGSLWESQRFASHFEKLHKAPWERDFSLDTHISIRKVKNTIQDFQEDFTFDLIYFDAFAPSKQPEMWELPVLEKVRRLMKPGSMLVSYCAQGQFKRNLKTTGLQVESLPGPPGKNEMTRAIL